MAIVMYTKPGCPYCQAARDHYNSNGIAFTEYDAQTDKSHQRDMLAITNGDRTVPAIIEDGVWKQSGWGDPPRG